MSLVQGVVSACKGAYLHVLGVVPVFQILYGLFPVSFGCILRLRAFASCTDLSKSVLQ